MCASGLAEYGNAARISAKRCNVVLDPLQCEKLILEAVVARGCAFAVEFAECEKAK